MPVELVETTIPQRRAVTGEDACSDEAAGRSDEEGVVTTEPEPTGPPSPPSDNAALARGAPEPGLIVRVLGSPSIPRRPNVRGKELTLAVYLACQQGPVSVDAVQHALWNGRPGRRKRVLNLISDTRRALGSLDDGSPAFPSSGGSRCGLRLARGVLTDLDLLRASHERATFADPAVAVGLIDQAFCLVEGPPFDGPGYEWAHHSDLLVAEASTLIEDTAWKLADIALALGDLDLARRTVRRGLRSLPGDESLYRLRMRIEHRAGNLAAIHSAYCELRSFLGDLGIEAQPSGPTVALYRQLTGRDQDGDLSSQAFVR